MNKTELIKAMKNHTGGGFISKTQLRDFMGFRDVHSVDRFCYGLQKTAGRLYFIEDVAIAIMNETDPCCKWKRRIWWKEFFRQKKKGGFPRLVSWWFLVCRMCTIYYCTANRRCQSIAGRWRTAQAPVLWSSSFVFLSVRYQLSPYRRAGHVVIAPPRPNRPRRCKYVRQHFAQCGFIERDWIPPSRGEYRLHKQKDLNRDRNDCCYPFVF